MLRLLFVIALLTASSCGSPDPAATPDAALPDQAICPDGGLYPCAPYGTSVGETAANLSFSGYMDPEHLCRAPGEQLIDLTTLRKVSFSDWHREAAACAAPGTKRRLLWVMVSAGWCNACSAEALDLQAMIKDGTLDPRVAPLSVLFETKTVGQAADQAFVKTWINAYKLTYPVVMDPTFAMGAFYSAKETPFNMLLDLGTMKVIYRRTGSNISGLKGAIAGFLK